MADDIGERLAGRQEQDAREELQAAERGGLSGWLGNPSRDKQWRGADGTYWERSEAGGPGFWGHYKFVPCADGKQRRVEPGTFPMAHGVPARVGKLRAYGNAIVPPLAAEFIKAFLEARESMRVTS